MRKSIAPQNPRNYGGSTSEDFYEDSTEDNEQLRADSFQLLENAPLSIGGYFSFSSERKWNDDDEIPNYFKLNATFLNQALDTIPFYKKYEGSNIPFNKDETEKMDKNASQIEKAFNKKYSSIIRASTATPPSASANILIDSRGNELDELLNMTSTINLSVPESTAVTPVPSDVKSDIQEWLDKVLED